MNTRCVYVLYILHSLASCTDYHSHIELHRSHFFENIAHIRKLIGPKKILTAVLKSNAYGHGLTEMAQLCEENPHVHYIAVFLLSEARYLRTIGIKKPILVLGGYDISLREALFNDLEIIIHDEHTLTEICTHAQHTRIRARVHLKIDTGMGRLGFLPQDALSAAQRLHKHPYIDLVGVCTHCAAANFDFAYTAQQCTSFKKVVDDLKKHGIYPPLIHIANSPIVLQCPEVFEYTNMVRCGGIIYGLYKEQYLFDTARKRLPSFTLKPIMQWKTKIIALKTLPPQSFVGYEKTYFTQYTTTIAVVPIGYYDGYYKELSNQGYMLVRNKLVPIIGRIAMNMTLLDMNSVPDAAIGDEVTIIGDRINIRARDIALQLGNIYLETLQSLNPAIPRIII
jgi:alanine racemase